MNIIATNHAYLRAMERMRWSKGTLDRLIERAFYDGKKHAEMRGRLKRYIDKLFAEHYTANNIRVYGENVWVFCENRLITIYRIPNNLLKYLKL